MSNKLQLSLRNEIEILTDFSKRAFESDISVGATEIGGPPGYDSEQFYLEMMHSKFLYSFFAFLMISARTTSVSCTCFGSWS